MLTVKEDKAAPGKYHLWSEVDRRYLLVSVSEQMIREAVRAQAVEAADAAVDDMLSDAEDQPRLN